jgi:hypothetical protein
MSTRHLCLDGLAVLHSTQTGMEGPKEQPLTFAALSDADGRWRVEPQDFGDGGVVRLPDVATPLGPAELSVSIDGAATGRWNEASGLWIEVPFVFTVKVPLLGSSDSFATVLLNTGTHRLSPGGPVATGRPYDPVSGQLALAGLGPFEQGHLDGVQLLIALTGRLQPAALG